MNVCSCLCFNYILQVEHAAKITLIKSCSPAALHNMSPETCRDETAQTEYATLLTGVNDFEMEQTHLEHV